VNWFRQRKRFTGELVRQRTRFTMSTDLELLSLAALRL
jgi:hypothetical protein